MTERDRARELLADEYAKLLRPTDIRPGMIRGFDWCDLSPIQQAAVNAIEVALTQSVDGWNSDMSAAPRDGTVRLRVIHEFTAEWRGGLLNEEGEDCGGWHAIAGDIPADWTDGICWSSNDDGLPSSWPNAWSPAPPLGGEG